jgi:hypothetical protein
MKLYAVSYYILIYGRIVSVFLSNYKANKTLIIKKLPSLTSATLTPFFFMFFGLLFLKGGGGGGKKKRFWKLQNLAKIQYICKKCLLFRCRHAVVIMQISNLTNQCSLFTTVRYVHILRSMRMTRHERWTIAMRPRYLMNVIVFSNAVLSPGVNSRAELILSLAPSLRPEREHDTMPRQ